MYREVVHAAVWAVRHLRGQLTPPELALIAPFISKGDTCLDIGAHAGGWLFPLGRLVGDQGLVMGFEALPYYARVLRLTGKLVGHRSAQVFNNAVTQDGRSVQMVWQDPSGALLTGRTHIAGAGESSAGSVEVAGVTVDGVCSRLTGRISFIKIDIEGAELGALRGGNVTLRKHRPIVYTEVVEEHLGRYGHSVEMLFQYFRDLDYKSFAVTNGRVVPLESAAAASFNDVLFAPSESKLCQTAQTA